MTSSRPASELASQLPESLALLGQGLFERIVESTVDLVTVVDQSGCFLYVNGAAERAYGISPKQCIGRSAMDFVLAEDRERTELALADGLQDPNGAMFSFENRQVGGSDGVRTYQWTITRHDAEAGAVFMSIARDVTEARESDLALQTNEARLRAVLSGMLDAVITIDPYGTVQDVSNSVEELFGYEPQELIGQNISIVMPEPYRSDHEGYLAKYRTTGETWILNTTREFPVVRKNGSLFDCELSVSRIDLPGGGDPVFCGAFRDVTQRKATELALQESERRFRAIFDQEFQFVGLLDPKGRILEVNKAALEATGTDRDDVVGRLFWDTPWWRHAPETQEALRQWIARAAEGEFVRSEIDFKNQTGELRTLDFSLKAVRGESNQITLIIPEGRDITGLKAAQRRETQMLKALATLGESAAILAHEIKNPITSVNVALRAVAKELGTDDREVLESLVERMQKLERKLRGTLSFAKPLDLNIERTNARQLLEAAADMLRDEAEARQIAISIEASASPPEMDIDVVRLEEVFTNLVRNAIDAIDASGRIELRAGRSDGHVEFTIDDSGSGIPDRMLGTLFQPFTTAKDEGTGLGLALCRKVIEAHGGTIGAGESPLGGARFTVHIPEVHRRPASTTEACNP
ncbi:MAG: PAS domain S-box protein [bacterium]|nr:PAS domain S-box protein [bacterium]